MAPCTPSDFKLYSMPNYVIPFYSMVSTLLGHLVAVFSSPVKSFLRSTSPGAMYTPPDDYIAFHPRPGFGFSFDREYKATDLQVQKLEDNYFRSMMFGKQLVWLKEQAEKTDYTVVMEFGHINESARVPDRFLNPACFSSYLILVALTTQICSVMHTLAGGGKTHKPTSSLSDIKGWFDLEDVTKDSSSFVLDKKDDPAVFTDVKAIKADGDFEELLQKVFPMALNLPTILSSRAVVNSVSAASGVLSAGHPSQITSHGKIFKYHPRLALSDPNLVGDVIGRRFLTCLGPDRKTQFENLQSLKQGLSAMRLLPIGNIFSHLYKCLDIAIDCQAGCAPIFSNKVYEGCVVMGGPGATFSHNGVMTSFENLETLRLEFTTVSTHASAIYQIQRKFPSTMMVDGEDIIIDLTGVTNMVELRKLCLSLECTQADRDFILRKASQLDFGEIPWVVSPIKLKSAFELMNDLSIIDDSYPISYLSLFSKDPVLIALSCFGAKSCPSWEIVSGTTVSLLTPNPPVIPARTPLKKGDKGAAITSDAAWVMTIRTTDLNSACDEFRKVVDKASYRSITSVLAKKQGMKSFSRDQMAVFWAEMQAAVLRMNSGVKRIEGLEASGKRKGTDDAEGPLGGGVSLKKTRLMF